MPGFFVTIYVLFLMAAFNGNDIGTPVALSSKEESKN
jgi:hypothetical protein